MGGQIKTIIFGILVSLEVFCLSELEAKELSRSIESELEAVSLEDGFLAADQCKCKNGFCEKNSSGRVVCQCFPEWGLDPSGDKCTKCDCGKGANCTYIQSIWGRISKKCVCPKGSYEDKITCKSCECGKDFDCKFSLLVGKKTCLCDTGYSQKGEVCVGTCSSNPCKNKGKCIVKGNDIACQCVAAYTGVLCEDKAVSPKETTMINMGSTTYPQTSTLKEFSSTPDLNPSTIELSTETEKMSTMINIGSTSYPQSSTFSLTPEPNPSTLAPSTETEKMTEPPRETITMTAPSSTESSTVNTRATTTSPTLELIKSLVVKILIYEKKI